MTAIALDFGRLLAAADAVGSETVDWDMFGRSISDTQVLMFGAYGPATRRVINLAVERHAGKPDAPFSWDALLRLAPEAFAQAEDRDFGGNVMHDYGILLQEKYGYGPTVLRLAQLAVARPGDFALAVPA